MLTVQLLAGLMAVRQGTMRMRLLVDLSDKIYMKIATVFPKARCANLHVLLSYFFPFVL